LLVGIFYLSGVIDFLSRIFEPVFVTWFGVPRETSAPLMAAFLRKDLAVAQLKGLADAGVIKNVYQMISSVALVSMYFPCLATFIMILKEGGKDFVKAILALFAAVFLYGGLLHLIWIIMGVG
ncbi:MAG TPA: ferrous iron transporter B, partial [Thermoplasmatales archaeon]|nr:ferrous iron transporter B [Thermoplasmatales archaeon]